MVAVVVVVSHVAVVVGIFRGVRCFVLVHSADVGRVVIVVCVSVVPVAVCDVVSPNP